MDAAGRALAEAQLRGHAALDAAYGPLAAEVRRIVVTHAVEGVVPPSAVPRIAREVEAALRAAEPGVAGAIGGAVAEAEAAVLGEAAPFTAVNAKLEAAGPLARNRPVVVEQIKRAVMEGAVRQLPVGQVAGRAADYFNPVNAPRWSADGTRLLRAGGTRQDWPAGTSMASQFPRGLMLTLATDRHVAATLTDARHHGRGVRYRLSPKHKDADQCDAAAHDDVGFGPGVYAAWPLGAAPRVPRHFRCRCYYASADLPEEVRPKAYDRAFPPDGFATLEDAAGWAAQHYPNVRWDFAGAHVGAVNPTLRQFDALATKYPEVVKRLQYVGTYRGPGAPSVSFGNGAWAHASRDGKRIGLNPEVYGDPDRFLRQLRDSAATGWHPKGADTIESVMTHEFGHQVENWLRTVPSNVAVRPVIDMSGRGLVRDTVERWRNQHRATRSVSSYALTSAEESWAEGFTMIHHAPRREWPVFVRRQDRLLNEVADGEKWLVEGEWKWLRDLPYEERAPGYRALDAWDKELNR